MGQEEIERIMVDLFITGRYTAWTIARLFNMKSWQVKIILRKYICTDVD